MYFLEVRRTGVIAGKRGEGKREGIRTRASARNASKSATGKGGDSGASESQSTISRTFYGGKGGKKRGVRAVSMVQIEFGE